MFKSNFYWFLFCVVLVALGAIAYYPSLAYEFDYGIDDGWLVVNNPGIKDLSWQGVYFLFFEDKLDPFYYPITYISLAIDYYFFGLDPFWMRAHNVVLHLASAVILFFLTQRIWGDYRVAAFTLVLFLLHPIQVENVVWINCRRQVLVVFYSLLSLTLFVRFDNSRKIKHYLGVVFFFTLALLSKFIAVSCIAFFFSYQLLISPRRIKRSAGTLISLFKIYSPLIVVSAFVFYKNMQASANNNIVQTFCYSVSEHVVIFFHSFGFYPAQVIWPLDLALFYPAPGCGKVYDSTFLMVSFAGVVVFAGVLLLIIKKYQHAAFALAVYVFGVFLTADVMAVNGDLPSTLADRHFYLGSAGLFMFAAGVGVRCVKNNLLLVAAGTLITLLLLNQTRRQITYWQSTKTILERSVSVSPSEEFYERLALEYYSAGDMEQSLVTLRKAEKLGLNIKLNNPFYFRLDLAALYFTFNDTTLATQKVAEALKADLKEIDKKTHCDVADTARAITVQLDSPFTQRNYMIYFKHRENMITNCGNKLNAGRP